MMASLRSTDGYSREWNQIGTIWWGCVYVCVCVRERECECCGGTLYTRLAPCRWCVCVCERERERVYVCVCERERVCVCVCV